MKVIFVASGNKRVGAVSSFVQSQYDSLEKERLEMVLFPVVGKGAIGYLKAVFVLRKLVRRERPDIIHAHYSTCGFVASLACLGLWHRPKIVVSILGSFPTRDTKWRRVRWAIQNLWDGALTKSERTRNQLRLDMPVIPNGVNLKMFHPIDHKEARKTVGFEPDKKYVVWCSHPTRKEKNWPLAEDAVRLLESKILDASVQLVAVYDKTPEEVCTYMNAADCLLLTSDTEGSPNVIKEAMACNCPIVTTNVGDVTERLAGLDGCYVVPISNRKLEIEDSRLKIEDVVAEAIANALAFGKRTEGNKRIIQDGLTIELTAKKIINWYESV